jgi:hypothetical protein
MQALAQLLPWMTIVAFLISIAFAIAPGPYTIAAFALIAMPLYLLIIAVYIVFVLQDLRGRRVL